MDPSRAVSQPSPTYLGITQETVKKAVTMTATAAITVASFHYCATGKGSDVWYWSFVGTTIASMGMVAIIRSCNGKDSENSAAFKADLLIKTFFATTTALDAVILGYAAKELLWGAVILKLSFERKWEILTKLNGLETVTYAIGVLYPLAKSILLMQSTPEGPAEIRAQLQEGRHAFAYRTVFPWLNRNGYGATATSRMGRLLGVRLDDRLIPLGVESINIAVDELQWYTPQDLQTFLLTYHRQLSDDTIRAIIANYFDKITLPFIRTNFSIEVQPSNRVLPLLEEFFDTQLAKRPQFPVAMEQLVEWEQQLNGFAVRYPNEKDDPSSKTTLYGEVNAVAKTIQEKFLELTLCSEFKQYLEILKTQGVILTGEMDAYIAQLSPLSQRLLKLKTEYTELNNKLAPSSDNTWMDPVSYLAGKGFNPSMWLFIVEQCSLPNPEGNAFSAVATALEARGIDDAQKLLNLKLWEEKDDNNPDVIQEKLIGFLGKKQQAPAASPSAQDTTTTPRLVEATRTMKKAALIVHALFQYAVSIGLVGLQFHYRPISSGLGVAWGLISRRDSGRFGLLTRWQTAPNYLPSITEFCRLMFAKIAETNRAILGGSVPFLYVFHLPVPGYFTAFYSGMDHAYALRSYTQPLLDRAYRRWRR